MARFLTLLDVLHARVDDGNVTVGYYDRRNRNFESENLAHVLRRCAATSERLLTKADSRPQPIMVAANTPRGLLEGFLGAVLAGRVPVLLPLRPTFDGRDGVAKKLATIEQRLPNASLLIQTNEGEPCVDPGERCWEAISEVGERGDLQSLLEDARSSASPDQSLHLQFTSGSTGDFKPVVLTNRNVLGSTQASVDRIELDPDDHLVSWLPLYHDMGLVGMVMTALVGGADLRLLSPFDFLSDPMHWLRAVAASPGSVTGAPNFAFEYTTRRANVGPDDGLDLSTWKKCYCGAEPVDSATIAAFIERFEAFGLRPEAVQPTYGLAEATLMVTMPADGELATQALVETSTLSTSGAVEVRSIAPMAGYEASDDAAITSIACLGRVADGLSIRLIDDDGRVIEGEDVSGEVVVVGDAVSPGYLQPDGSVEAFEGGCRTGDIGFLHDGELYLIERRRNIIIRNGQNYSAAAVERHLAHQLGIDLDSCAVIQNDIADGTIVAVVEATRRIKAGEVVATVNQARDGLDLTVDRVLIVGRNRIPRTSSGKKQHARLRSLLRSGEVVVLEQLDVVPGGDELIDLRSSVSNQRVLEVVERHARRSGWSGGSIDESLRLRADLGLDSLATIEMAVDLEAEAGLVIPETRLAELRSVADLLVLAAAGREPTAGSIGASNGHRHPETEAEGETSHGVGWAIDQLTNEIPQIYRTVDRQEGRRVLIDGRWIDDFGSVNYLGFDLRPEVAKTVGPTIERWGTHPSWTRAVASPRPYRELEVSLAHLIGAPDAMAFSTITLAHIGLMPLLATGADTVILDEAAHNSVMEGAELAATRGADLRRFHHGDLGSLDRALAGARGRPVVAVNGVYSMTGSVADLKSITARVAQVGGLVYVDDAHGFGILGADPGPGAPYGLGGGGVVAHLGLDYRNIVYVAGLSKAYSSMAAFVSCFDDAQRALFERASTSVFSGPIPVASLATALAGIELNATEGDGLRAHLHDITNYLISGACELGFAIDNPLAFPIVNLFTGNVANTVAAAKVMWGKGLLFTPSVFPAARLDQGGFRVSLTATHTRADVDRLLNGLDAVAALLSDSPIRLVRG